jgi:regulator of cell morphogenesis and NO signaling
MDTPEIIDITVIGPRLKHPVILEKFDALRPENAMVIVDDHDPGLLYYLLLTKRGRAFQWKVSENGPAIWRIEIIKKATSSDGETIGMIVSGDYRKAQVLKSLDIDFSCSGNKTIEQACEEKGLSYEDVQLQLAEIDSVAPEKETNYLNWDIAFLTNYIIEFHHRFVNTQTRFITELAHKVAESDRVRHPEIKQVADLFANTGRTLELKGAKEETVLFPYITELNTAYKNGTKIKEAAFGYISELLYLMQTDCEKVAEDFRLIRQLTNGYVAPAYTSNTCAILYKLLAAYEEDMHLHLHLENNILFPKALEMEDLLRAKQLIF